MSEAPTIVVTGMCNTKGVEIRFLADQVVAHGGRPLIKDLRLGGTVYWADISLGDVLAATGTDRPTAAGALGIPQVVAPGGNDQAALGALDRVPQRYLDDIASGRRQGWRDTGLPYLHNPSVTILLPTCEEVEVAHPRPGIRPPRHPRHGGDARRHVAQGALP